MNLGLGKYDSVLIVRMYQSMLAVFSILSGYFYFDEISAQSTLSIGIFFVGFITSVMVVQYVANDSDAGRFCLKVVLV